MRTAIHSFLSWLLMLSMLLAPMQAVMAMDHSQPSMSAPCLQMMAGEEAVDARFDGLASNQMVAADPCQDPSSPMPCPQMQGCSSFSSLSLFPQDGMDFLPRVSPLFIRLGDLEARLITRYPDLLQRPPQA